MAHLCEWASYDGEWAIYFCEWLTYFDDCATNLFCLLNEVSDPTPAPPLQGRGAATALFAGWESAGPPLPCRGGAGVGSLTNREGSLTNRVGSLTNREESLTNREESLTNRVGSLTNREGSLTIREVVTIYQ